MALVLLVLVPAACVPTALAFAEGGTSITQQQREERAAKRKALLEERRAVARAEREERLAKERARREALSGTRETEFGRVLIGCSSITWIFKEFPESPPTRVREIVTIDGHSLPAVYYTVPGKTGSNTTPFTEVPGLHKIDARASWKNGEFKGGWDISSRRICTREPNPGYVIEKRQTIVGGHGGFVPTPLTGEVGQTIAYEIVVTNTGNVSLTFGNFSDPHCDPGTLTGGPTRPIEPGVAIKLRCTHLITAADQQAGSYANVASITGTPSGQPPIEHESNTVVVDVPTPATLTPAAPGNTAQGGTSPSSGPLGSSGVLAATESHVPRITPVLGRIGIVKPVSGKVFVRLPHTRGFVLLTGLRAIPFGTVIDTTAGRVLVIAARPHKGTQSGEFFAGVFVLNQASNGVVTATLAGSACPRAHRRGHRAAVSARRKVRRLWANAHGTFTTRGNYAAGAVQGTEWLTEDRCEGTVIRVTRDKVKVTDLVHHRSFIVRAGHRVLVKRG